MPDPTWLKLIEEQERQGITRADAVAYVIAEWLCKGDPEPLLWALATEEVVNPLLSLTCSMLVRDESVPYYLELTRQPGQLGAPEKPGLDWRDAFAAVAYAKRRKVIGSDAAFEETAAQFGISVSAVRRAVTLFRQRMRYRLTALQAIDPPTTNNP
jgi:hypothetical protein